MRSTRRCLTTAVGGAVGLAFGIVVPLMGIVIALCCILASKRGATMRRL